MEKKNEKQANGLQLSKSSTPEVITNYFRKIFELKSTGKSFPVDFDQVWPLVYSRRENALRVLKSDFVEGEDFHLRQNDEVVKINNLRNGVKIKAVLSVGCLEYFIAKKVKPVFEVYRTVFHASIENGQKQQAREIGETATYTNGGYFSKKLDSEMVVGYTNEG